MIIRERQDEFIFIEQHNHALVSGELAKQWRKDLLSASSLPQSVIYAIEHHDAGWVPADKEPFWNDAKGMPYSFIDFPAPTKTLLYTYGIDEVQKTDAYAALLCSEHYVRFLQQEESESAKHFVQQEQKRQESILSSLPSFYEEQFDYHYALLQFCDNLSLFLCLNEPGKNTHPFFTKGIPLPSTLPHFSQEKMAVTWVDQQRIALKEFPFENTFTITYDFKQIPKFQIEKSGLLNSYVNTPFQQTTIELTKAEAAN